MKRFFAPLLILSVIAIGVACVFPAASVFADSKGEICKGVNAAAGGTGCAGGATDLNKIITVFLNLFSVIIGVVAVVMIMYGGFKYVTSGGDSGNVTTAKHTIMYALIGLIIVAMAQFLVQFVLDKAT